MGNLDNFRYAQGEMETAIGELEASKNKASGNLEEIKATLRQDLLAAGMTGTTADAMLETFEKEIAKPATDYLDTADHFINQNRNVHAEMSSNSADNVRTASMER